MKILTWNLKICQKHLNINNSIGIAFMNKLLKTNLLVDIFNLVGITPFSQEIFNNKHKEININDSADDLINNAFTEFSRPKSNYELIFPVNENTDRYKKFFKDKNEINELFWKKLK